MNKDKNARYMQKIQRISVRRLQKVRGMLFAATYDTLYREPKDERFAVGDKTQTIKQTMRVMGAIDLIGYMRLWHPFLLFYIIENKILYHPGPVPNTVEECIFDEEVARGFISFLKRVIPEPVYFDVFGQDPVFPKPFEEFE